MPPAIPASISEVDLVDAGWRDVLELLPPDLERMAKEEFGFRRRGQIRSAGDVLRIGMAYAVLDFSLRSTSA